MGNCINTPEEENEIAQKCGYKGCDSSPPKNYYKYCDTHYKLQGQFIEMYHYFETDYGVPLPLLSIVELEMRLKYADLYQIPCDEGHMFRNLKLYKKIDKRSVLYRKSYFIKMYEADLIKFDKQQRRKKN